MKAPMPDCQKVAGLQKLSDGHGGTCTQNLNLGQDTRAGKETRPDQGRTQQTRTTRGATHRPEGEAVSRSLARGQALPVYCINANLGSSAPSARPCIHVAYERTPSMIRPIDQESVQSNEAARKGKQLSGTPLTAALSAGRARSPSGLLGGVRRIARLRSARTAVLFCS